VGPGAFLIEAVVGSAALGGAIFEDAQAGSVDVVAGYRWML
jgi:hypothetical protein